MRKFITFASALALLPAMSLQAQETTSESEAPADWAFEESDIAVDPGFTFGVLDNGMRYILRENATPEGTALVRLHIDSGSLDETDSELGLAHFVEHMAFNGTTNVPEGEMIKLLEREGLAFGADTNASTGFEATTYKLDLPRNDVELLDTVLMIMRETASEMTISQEAVDRERGIILAERRDRRNFGFKALEDNFAFIAPDARFPQRLPIGKPEIIENASAADLRGFYERTYVPENAVLVIVGDFPVAVMEEKLLKYFADWSGGARPAEQATGPLDISRKRETDIYIDPALSESVSITRFGEWKDRPDTLVNRQQSLQRRVGYGIINRRLRALAVGEGAPFRGASFGSSDTFEDARSTTISIASADGEWRKGLEAATIEVRRALMFGFSQAEVNEQIANIRSSREASARAAETRSNGALVGAALNLINNDSIPTTPASRLERFNNYVDQITPESALAAVQADAIDLTAPLIRFQGRAEPEGGADALRAAWQEALAVEVTAPDLSETVEFAYEDFGPAGEVVEDEREDRLDFRKIRFANGVRLNLKKTDIREDRIQFRVAIDGGGLLDTKEAPLTTALVSTLPAGGLGAHSQDELTTVLAGKQARFSLGQSSEHFLMSGTTIPQDLLLQMQLVTAGLTDPGYRIEGEERFHKAVDVFFASLDATPAAALNNQLGGILSDGDPRFSLQSREAYREQTFAKLKSAIGDRLANGAIEVTLVGDFEEEAAIAAIAATLGALPEREAEFLPRTEARQRSFTADRSQRILTHTGEADQALLRTIWPTTDDRDLRETWRLSLLARVAQLKVTDQLREALGKAYSPGAWSSQSAVYPNYGTFQINAALDVSEVKASKEAIAAVIEDLRNNPVDEDTLQRARKPLLERYDNTLKSLGGWMGLVNKAQSKPERLERYFQTPEILNSLTGEDMQATAIQYLIPGEAVEILVRPVAKEAQDTQTEAG